MSEIIEFYRIQDKYGEFSNFAPFPIAIEDRRWRTSEHYFQAQKFLDDEYRESIRQTPSPMIAARMGRSRQQPLRPDWESVKVSVMREAVMAKFTQHDRLRKLLFSPIDPKGCHETTSVAIRTAVAGPGGSFRLSAAVLWDLGPFTAVWWIIVIVMRNRQDRKEA
jgi:hypothetical protein